MKKLILALVVLAIALLTVFSAGCSPNKGKQDVSDPEFPTLTDTRSTETEMKNFVTLNGNTVSYNVNTRKIVCIFGSQDVVAFGIKLLAYEETTNIEGFESFYEGAKRLNNSTPFSAEEVQSYEPELILVNQRMSASDIETLSKIAPVIPLYTDSDDFSVRLKYIGAIFGLSESAEKLIEYSESIKTFMLDKLEKLGLSDKTLTVYTYLGDITIPPERGWFMNTILYEYLKIKRLDIVKDFMQDETTLAYEPIADEKLRDYEGDLVIFAGLGESEISTYVSENVGWQSLRAVRENRVGVVDMLFYAQKGVILLYGQYDNIYNALVKAAGVSEVTDA